MRDGEGALLAGAHAHGQRQHHWHRQGIHRQAAHGNRIPQPDCTRSAGKAMTRRLIAVTVLASWLLLPRPREKHNPLTRLWVSRIEFSGSHCDVCESWSLPTREHTPCLFVTQAELGQGPGMCQQGSRSWICACRVPFLDMFLQGSRSRTCASLPRNSKFLSRILLQVWGGPSSAYSQSTLEARQNVPFKSEAKSRLGPYFS